MSYILRIKSDYSFNSSTLKIDDIISYCKINGLNRCFLVDDNLFGSLSFYNKCIKEHIKPIVGLNVKINYDNVISNLVVIAKSELGFKNLSYISSISYNNEITLQDISMHLSDLIVIINSDDSYISLMLKENKMFEVNNFYELLSSLTKSIYFGVYRYSGIDNDKLNEFIAYARHNNIPLVASSVANHKNTKDTLTLNILHCLKNKIPANKDFLNDSEKVNSYLKKNEEIRLSYEKEEIDNLDKLAALIKLVINKVDFKLPSVTDKDQSLVLKEQSFNKLKELNLENEKYINRLNYELEVIISKGFANYYLIVADYVNYAKNNDIPTSIRGSGISSLVAYLLNISSIDPLKHDLLFERFLNEKRSNYPDFDMDFEDISRNKIIDYVTEKYGKDNVAYISTFATYGSKGAINEVAKLLKKSDEVAKEITKLMSNDVTSINDEYKNNIKFKSLLDIHSDYKLICSIASDIEKLNKQVGTHPAGLILSCDNIKNLTPTIINSEGNLQVSYEASDAEAIGLIKMDFLSLKNLTVLNYCLKKINKQFNLNYTFDNYPYDDKKAYELICNNDTIGLFQIDTLGMKDVIRKLKPNCFDDVCNLIALFRPGSMGFIDEFIARKEGKPFKYYDDSLIDILKPTYGIIIYQEQIMQICQKVALFDLAKADIFRKAISKKNYDVLLKQKEDFISGAVSNNYTKEVASKLFEVILKFAEYGFNKAHSVGYSKFVCILASIKANYPAIFYESLLVINKEKNEGLRNLFNEAKHYNVLPIKPNINLSDVDIKIVDEGILLGLTSISDISENIANIIVNERNIEPFNDIYDFVIRMVKNDVSIHVIENLIYSGALDVFNIKKEKIIGSLNALYEFGWMFYKFNYKPNSYKDYKDIMIPIMFFENNEIDYIKKEYDVLGLYISTHPIRKIKDSLDENITNIDEIIEDGFYNIVAKVLSFEIKKNKDGKDYYLFKVEDETKLVTIRDYKCTYKVEKGTIIKANITNKANYFYLNRLEEVK